MALHTTNPGDTKRQMNLAPFAQWSATQQYNTDDLVVSSSGVWKALQNNRAQNPDENTYWTKVVGGGGAATGACLTVSSTTDNKIEICGSTAGSAVQIHTTGSDTNVPLWMKSKGNAGLIISGVDPDTWHLVFAPYKSVQFAQAAGDSTDGSNADIVQIYAGASPVLYGINTGGTLTAPTDTPDGNNLWSLDASGFSSSSASILSGGQMGFWRSGVIGTQIPTNLFFYLNNSTAGVSVGNWTTTSLDLNANLTVGNTNVFSPAPKLTLTSSGGITAPNLPSTNPAVLGALYRGAANAIFWSTGP